MKISSHKKHNLFLFKINPLIRLLIFSDMIIVGAMGMFSPLYALFVTEYIEGANEFTIGLSISIYLVARSIFQIPLATLLDRIKGEKDDYYIMVLGSVIVGILHFAYLGISTIWELYTLQMLLGVFSAITYPAYMALFTRHIDKDMEGTEWGVYYTFIDLGSAALATLGGYIANEYGYNALIIVVSLLCILGSIALIPVKSKIFKEIQ
ncbi:MAG: MFS transporter [Patescibacteria group bacterium]